MSLQQTRLTRIIFHFLIWQFKSISLNYSRISILSNPFQNCYLSCMRHGRPHVVESLARCHQSLGYIRLCSAVNRRDTKSRAKHPIAMDRILFSLNMNRTPFCETSNCNKEKQTRSYQSAGVLNHALLNQRRERECSFFFSHHSLQALSASNFHNANSALGQLRHCKPSPFGEACTWFLSDSS